MLCPQLSKMQVYHRVTYTQKKIIIVSNKKNFQTALWTSQTEYIINSIQKLYIYIKKNYSVDKKKNRKSVMEDIYIYIYVCIHNMYIGGENHRGSPKSEK